jgi:hypothetical protein
MLAADGGDEGDDLDIVGKFKIFLSNSTGSNTA